MGGLGWLALIFLLFTATPALAHPAPFSYLDIRLHDGQVDGTLVVHDFDAAHELGLASADPLLEPKVVAAQGPRLAALIGPRLALSAGRPLTPEWTGFTALPDRSGVQLSYRIRNVRPGALTVHTDLFPYDRNHQTFVNLYEDGRLRQQWIFARGSAPRTYYLGTASGVFEVMKAYVPAGAHHILVGPDHLLFLVGLLLLGGSWKTLVKMVTAFTLAHSVTLSLAALGIVTPPARLIEPAIALSIIVVGVDNLIRAEGRDLRAWAALAFGLVHGFGFASVLRETGLPREALGWSLFSFNLGVEIGQLAVVIPVATALAMLRRHSPMIAQRVAVAGSVVVIAAGGYWFLQRIFFPGGA